MINFSLLVQFLFSGLTMGSIYALLAVSLVIVYNVSRVICFAQGEFFVFGALMITWLTSLGLSTPIAFLLTVLATSMMGAVIERAFIRPVSSSSEGTIIVMTVGISLTLMGVALLAWGREAHALPPFSKGEPLWIFGACLSIQVVWIMGATVLVLVIIWLFFNKTLLGIAMRACSENRLAANLMGISVWKMNILAWAWGSGLGALAGMVVAPLLFTQYASGTMPMLKGFIAMSIGGYNVLGTVVGGFVLGVIEAYSIGLVSSQFSDAIVFTVLIIALLTRPQGIFGALKRTSI
jgi:branched-chain amino acid transport system permease protein